MAKITTNQIRTLHNLTKALPDNTECRIRFMYSSERVVLVWKGGDLELEVESSGDYKIFERHSRIRITKGKYR